MAVGTEERKYIPLKEAAESLGVVRGTIYHYMRTMKIRPKKFPMDRNTYLSRADYERLLAAKRAAQEGRHE